MSQNGIPEQRSVIEQSGKLFGCTLLLLSLLASCSWLENEPPPTGYFHMPMPASPPDNQPVQVAACRKSDTYDANDPIVPVLVAVANGSQTAWTLDAEQISAGDQKIGGKWLPIPPEEGARMALVRGPEKGALILDRMADFATFGAGLGAAGGAFAARAKGDDASNGFALGAGYGAVIGGILGFAWETWRLDSAYETKEAGDANEKMKFLALKDKSILYSNDAAIGYVYFAQNITNKGTVTPRITIPLIRGDPSKDWIAPPTYDFSEKCEDLAECKSEARATCTYPEKCKNLLKECEKPGTNCIKKPTPEPPDRYEAIDLSPIVCECSVELAKCNEAQNRIECFAAAKRDDHGSCESISNQIFVHGIALPPND